MEFEWDDAKAADNLRKHGVSFAESVAAFSDPFAIEIYDDRKAYGEERIILIGMSWGRVLTIVYTERAGRSRTYRLAVQPSVSKNITIARIGRDGRVMRVKPEGAEEALPYGPARRMTAAQIRAAAVSDPDNPPLTAAQLARLRRVPRVKTLRRALGLTQEEFAQRYQIPLGTLRDWEQGRTQPDQPARAYLMVIARDPEAVRRALQSGANPSA